MSLSTFVATVEAEEKTLTVFSPRPGAVDALRDRFGDRHLSVTEADSPHGPRNFAVLSDDDRFLAAADVDDLLADAAGDADAAYRPILDHLPETLFTAVDRQEMLDATREIEDRAWRRARGSLYAGFQTAANLRPQADVYRRLGSRESLAVHAYVATAEDPPPLGETTLHCADTDELRRSWFAVYDPPADADARGSADACALLAEERGDGGFYGFWTYDPEMVADVVDYLREAYADPE
ncbi:MAG: DICT sensory domain-containing protein [Haloferacaceae archaeon]